MYTSCLPPNNPCRHGDELVLADANFPSASVAAMTTMGVVEADGLGIPSLLRAILKLLPLDETVAPCAVMGVMPEHTAAGFPTPVVWAEYKAIVAAAESHRPTPPAFQEVERFEFYERAKKAFAVVHTGESALYGNLILKKGVLGPETETGAEAEAGAGAGEGRV
jgi:L-fucose mutarotase